MGIFCSMTPHLVRMDNNREKRNHQSHKNVVLFPKDARYTENAHAFP